MFTLSFSVQLTIHTFTITLYRTFQQLRDYYALTHRVASAVSGLCQDIDVASISRKTRTTETMLREAHDGDVAAGDTHD